jgi:hypothetical protein
MTPFNHKFFGAYLLTAIVALAAAGTGCTDVGDNSSGGGTDGSASDAESPDASLGTDTSLGADGQGSPEATAGDDGSPSGQDAGVDSTTTPPDAGMDGGQTVEPPDADAGAAAPEAGGPDATVSEAGTPEAGTPEAGAPEAGVDAGTHDAGEHDAGGADAPTESGAEAGSSLLPCTTASQTNCVHCDQNTNGLCTPTEAIIVSRDIEKGLVTGTTLSADSCYECAGNAQCINSQTNGFTLLECGDLTGAAVQECLDTLNCILGSPQSGTAGANGTINPAATPATLAADCSAVDPMSGVYNCFCGTNDSTTTLCAAAPTVSAAASNSPNGICLTQILTGTGATSSTANATIISDLSNTALGAGQAFAFPLCAGSNLTAGQACEQCYK